MILIGQFMQRFSSSDNQAMELVFGRKRLVQVLSAGHREGLLTDVQNRLVNGLLEVAAQPVTEGMTFTRRVIGLPDSATRTQFKDHAKKHNATHVLVRHESDPGGWFGYVRTIDLSLEKRPMTTLIHQMTVLDQGASKLEAMVKLRDTSSLFGLVTTAEGVPIGIVDERSMTESLFRQTQRSPQISRGQPGHA